MSELHKIKIVEPYGQEGLNSTIELDGMRLKGVTRYSYSNDCRDVKRLTIELIVEDVDLQTEPPTIDSPRRAIRHHGIINFTSDENSTTAYFAPPLDESASLLAVSVNGRTVAANAFALAGPSKILINRRLSLTDHVVITSKSRA